MAGPHDEIAPFVPLSEKDFHTLFAFSEGAVHGYAVVRSVEDRTNGLVRLEPANLYRRIQQLVDDALLVETAPPSPEVDDRRRRFYELTDLGRRVLAHEVARWRALVAEAAERDPAL